MLLKLEIFDEDQVGFSPPAGPSEEFTAGYEAGEAAALAAMKTEQAVLHSELVQSIADAAFGFEEAHAHIVQNLNPLFQVMLEQLLPSTLSHGLVAALSELLNEAAAIDASQPVTLLVNQGQVAIIEAALEGVSHEHFKIAGDPSLGAFAALTQTAQGETAFDLEAALAKINETFTAFQSHSERSISHG